MKKYTFFWINNKNEEVYEIFIELPNDCLVKNAI